ncbi:MAG TPA: hypothetical protein PLN32_05240 [Methanoregulaceae archaeon]|nr:hypothetical protein [Methanoregulaceae archaeon]
MRWEKVLIVLLILNLASSISLIFLHCTSCGIGFGEASPVLYAASGIGSGIGNNATSLPGNETDSIEDWYRIDSQPEETLKEPVQSSGGNQSGGGSLLAAEPLQLPAVKAPPTSRQVSVSSPDGWIGYTSSRHPFSLRYPETWTINEKPTGSARAILQLTAPVEIECEKTGTRCYKYMANMTVDVDPTPVTLVPDEYFIQAVADLQGKYSITTTSKSAPCIISGIRAYQIEFYTRDKRGNPDKSSMQYYVIVDGKAYIISYTGPYSTWENVYSNNKGDAQHIIDSIVFRRNYLEG